MAKKTKRTYVSAWHEHVTELSKVAWELIDDVERMAKFLKSLDEIKATIVEVSDELVKKGVLLPDDD